MQKYNFWGEKQEPPSNLKTIKELAAQGYKALKPVGYISNSKIDILLYDISDKNSTEIIKSFNKNNQNKEGKKLTIDRLIDKISSIITAKKWLESPKNYVIIDTERGGIEEIIELGVIGLDGKEIYQSYFKPKTEIPSKKIREKLEKIKTKKWEKGYNYLTKTILNKTILSYDVIAEKRAIEKTNEIHEIENKEIKTECVMREYAKFVNEYDENTKNYKNQKLGGPHNALGDCQKTLEIIKKMAKTRIVINKKIYEKYNDKLIKYREYLVIKDI